MGAPPSATTRWNPQAGLAAPQLSQPLGALALNQRDEPRAKQGGPVEQAGQLAGVGKQLFVDIDGGAHAMAPDARNQLGIKRRRCYRPARRCKAATYHPVLIQSPDLPPCFSSTRMLPITMPRSAALHMS